MHEGDEKFLQNYEGNRYEEDIYMNSGITKQKRAVGKRISPIQFLYPNGLEYLE
jgi:hypothetical protein